MALTVPSRRPLGRDDELESPTLLAWDHDAEAIAGITVARLAGGRDVCDLIGHLGVVVCHENEVDHALRRVLPVDVDGLTVLPGHLQGEELR